MRETPGCVHGCGQSGRSGFAASFIVLSGVAGFALLFFQLCMPEPGGKIATADAGPGATSAASTRAIE
ncbi:hypothetical protein [Paraburkholderia hospita]|uniref:hypothetical protein n=1 Tax=Paraburkholderia hospita TaxID=169430 RepID=UPI000A3FC1F4|nr:hypothetical protein [Paraburkholderia hospita]